MKALKRVVSVCLSVLLVLSMVPVEVFGESEFSETVSPSIYKWRIYVESRNNTGGWNSERLCVYGKSSEEMDEELLLDVKNWKIDFKGTRENTFGRGDQITTQFPTKVTYLFRQKSR